MVPFSSPSPPRRILARSRAYMHVHRSDGERRCGGTTCKCCRLLMPGRFHSRDVPLPPRLKDVGALFSLHAGGRWPAIVGPHHMDEDGLRRCLDDSNVDGDMLSPQFIPARQRRTGPPPIPRRQQLFTLVDFHRILFSHDLNPPIRQQHVAHDMTLPLSHYFIYSSDRSDESIIRELKMGVRAIEVAMWPDSKGDEIEIHHGWTWNTPLLLAECLKSIKEHAFVASPYPVIITLEDKLQSSNLQKKAAKVMLDVLGDILYWPHTDHIDVRGNTDSNNPLKEFPSPEELKGRVLLSTKAPIIKKEKAQHLQLGKGADDDDDAAWGAQVLQYEIQSVKMHDGDDEDQKEQKMQPHVYPPYHHLTTFRPEKQEAIDRVYEYPPPMRVPTLPRRGGHETIETIERAPILPGSGGLELNKTIERVSTLDGEPRSAQLQLGKGADGDDAAWRAQLPDFQTEIQSAKKHGGDVSGHQRRRNNDNDDEIRKNKKMQPHAYPPYHHMITIPNESEAIERVPILPRRGGLRANKIIERVSTLSDEPGEVWRREAIERVPILPRRGGLGGNKIIERVSTLSDEPGEVWRREAIERVPLLPRRRGLRGNKTIERVPTLSDEPVEVWRRGGLIRTNKTIERVSTLESEPRRRRVPGDGGPFPHVDPEKKPSEHERVHVGSDIVRFTQRNILRIYPSISSSNYNPFVGWVHGAQMVALNMQEYGRALWLMHGFYRANGGCGYVRKPDFLMQTKPEVFDPRKRQPAVKKTLKVKVYMGDGWRMDFKHAHTSFIPDLWTSVGIAGVPADTTAMQNTKATENTWVPVWQDEFSFALTVPEIALLRVEVHQYDVSEKDIFGGQTVLPVWELRPGIRAVALFDRQGNRLPNVRLLMRFEFD